MRPQCSLQSSTGSVKPKQLLQRDWCRKITAPTFERDECGLCFVLHEHVRSPITSCIIITTRCHPNTQMPDYKYRIELARFAPLKPVGWLTHDGVVAIVSRNDDVRPRCTRCASVHVISAPYIYVVDNRRRITKHANHWLGIRFAPIAKVSASDKPNSNYAIELFARWHQFSYMPFVDKQRVVFIFILL